ncbi:MAG: phospho-sugar mutase [Clostridiaceae bacterium]|nr:phospho-sugar mutase [Clostridiaceae bacterium]
MSRAQDLYQLWSADPAFDPETRAELRAIAADPAEIEDRFYCDLSFGTAGLRGVLGAGTNRMNAYTVAKASEGLARCLSARGPEACARGLVVSYDSRHRSREFALITALIFAGHGIPVRLSDELRPVPMLSFAIRHYHAAAGVMITASHNPAKYNGFKAYGEDGGQLPPEDAAVVSRAMDEIRNPAALRWPDEAKARALGLLTDMGRELDQAYNDMLLGVSINGDAARRQSDMSIVYTPLHGAGNKPVRRILASLGFKRVLVVPEQEKPDPDFSTVAFPNPEERSALAMAIALAERENADLVIATDPDADRTGLCVRSRDGSYVVLSGNQIGLLLTDYILSAKKKAGALPPRSFVISTIVSTKLTRRIAEYYGVTLFECLTGFKFIGELIKEKDEQGDMHFQFGFEESFGYLAGHDVRDKDAVVTSMLISEMAAAARERGLTLYDLLQELYRRFGYAAEYSFSIFQEGKEGLERISKSMAFLRQNKAAGIPGLPVTAVRDYLEQDRLELGTGRHEPLDLPESNVLLYELQDLDWFCVRPSGTEPKIKIYFGFYGPDPADCRRRLDEARGLVESLIRSAL